MSRYPRRTALVLSLLFPLAIIVAEHHRATAHHAHCTEHGELIHGHPESDHEHDDHGTRPGLERDHHLEGNHGCGFLDLLNQPRNTALVCTFLSWTPVGPVVKPVRSRIGFEAIRLLDLSPKTSPPAA